MPDLLLEIGLEEVPARMIAAAQAELLKRTLALLTREQLLDPVHANAAEPIAHAYSTPRRLAVLVRNVLAQQPDITEDAIGPAVKIAFKEGVPTPAAEAFARKSGVAVADLRTISTPKGDYLAATTLKRGRPAAELLAAELPKEIAALYWAKNMYWRPGKPERFVRPVLWLVCLFGEEVVPLTFAGKTAARLTFGHRVLFGDQPITITAPTTYLTQLESAHVLADVELRRHKIRKALDHATRTVPGLRWREDHALVDAVTHLTEWPDVLLGAFDPAYLALPEEVLVTVMRDHQKYFAVEDSALRRHPRESAANEGPPYSEGAKLAPYFLTVTNIALNETNTPIIKQGNERVLRARFNDARFFWDFDQKIPLQDRVNLLENVTFQKDLGTYAAKSERVRKAATFLAEAVKAYIPRVSIQVVDRAAILAKTDLTTELVKEFTELQGVIGGLYAESQGEGSPVARAIYDQYKPTGAEDFLPATIEGAILGIADRMDTIAGMFKLGIIPTGSKDPFALRRAANAVVRLIAETEVGNKPDILQGALELAIARHTVPDEPGISSGASDEILLFFRERIEFYLREVRGHSYDLVTAVMAAGYLNVKDILARAEAVSVIRGSEDFIAVSAAFKRMKNILIQAEGQNSEMLPFEPKFDTVFETEFWTQINKAGAGFGADCNAKNYGAALIKLARLRLLIDRYFESVMVMHEDRQIRASRLGTLRYLATAFSRIADFSEIVTTP
jgi:glycyl-tRNA synthetase beta chain